MTDDTPARPRHHVPTLMTVHAHPDDEMIGTGGPMARPFAPGRRVVLVTCTRGEMGEIVVPEMDTPENHRRLGEIRAGELERAMAALGVTEWENLGYRDSDMMGRPGNRDARCFWQANLDEAIGRLVFLVRTYRPDVMTTYNDFGGYGHPDHIRTHLVAVGAFERAGDPTWYPEQLAPEHGGTGAAEGDGGLAPWAPAKLYEQAIPASVRNALQERMEEIGERSFWSPPRGRDARADRGVRGVRRADARPRRDDHHLGRRAARARRALGGVQGARDPDPATRTRSCASGVTPGPSSGPTRRTSGASRASRRPTPETDLFEGLEAAPATPPGRARLDGGRRSRARQAGQTERSPRTALARAAAARRVPDLVHHELAGARGSMKFGWALSRIRCGRIRDLDELLAAERQLEREALHRVLGPGLVEHEVAERVPDRLALVDLHALGPVRVVADDEVRAGVDGRVAERPLARRAARGTRCPSAGTRSRRRRRPCAPP